MLVAWSSWDCHTCKYTAGAASVPRRTLEERLDEGATAPPWSHIRGAPKRKGVAQHRGDACVCVNARVFVFCGSLLFRGCGCCNCLPGSLGWSQVAGGEQFVLARMVFVGLLSWSLDFDLSLVRGGNPKRDLT